MWLLASFQLRAQGIDVGRVRRDFHQHDFVNQHAMYDWMNAWNPYDYDYKLKYNIESTPQIFILDKDKKIQAKRIGPEQVEEIIDMLIRRDEYLKKESKVR